ncbi:hypothetical protein [Serinicoccus sediminis]|uniref:hypothetical protein n=1 Tax=Serinicoccus sediminis TaxID=2306021 RepID=UPI0013EBC56A|nr:hypothetical protein [Serinicoccus sediminis]
MPDLTATRALVAAAHLDALGRSDLADTVQHGTDQRHELTPTTEPQEDTQP